MRIVGYHISSKGIICNSDGEITDKPPYLDWLLEPKPDTLKILYNMTQSIASLAKITNMTLEEIQELTKKTKAYFPPYKIDYIANKYFAIHKGYYWGAPFAFFADAHQYKNTEVNEDRNNIDCFRKAEEARRIGEVVYNTLRNLGLNPKSLTSPIKTFETEVLSKMDLPKIDNIPLEAGHYAYECCKGNWVEAFQLGHWKQTWNYDMISAYPAQIAKLLDIRKGKWIQSKEYLSNAQYGYCRGTIDIDTDVTFTPLLHRQENKELPALYGVTGKYETFLTKKELDFLLYFDQGTFIIEDGWWWHADDNADMPLKNIINWLFLEKEKNEGESRTVIKRTMAAIFGKMLEIRNNQFGEQFNPVWAAETEVGTRIDLGTFVMSCKTMPIHLAVDNFIVDNPVAVNQLKIGMGEWELNDISPCICAGTGAVATREIGSGDFHLTYDWFKQMIEENPEATEYQMSKTIPVSVHEAANTKYNKLGELQTLTKSIAIGKGEKRCYKRQPKKGEDLLENTYTSLPWDISLIKKE